MLVESLRTDKGKIGRKSTQGSSTQLEIPLDTTRAFKLELRTKLRKMARIQIKTATLVFTDIR